MPLSDTGETRVNLSRSPQRIDELRQLFGRSSSCILFIRHVCNLSVLLWVRLHAHMHTYSHFFLALGRVQEGRGGDEKPFEVMYFVCVCVWDRKAVGACPRPYPWESWPADLAACPNPHQQSQRWVPGLASLFLSVNTKHVCVVWKTQTAKIRWPPVLILTVLYEMSEIFAPWASLPFFLKIKPKMEHWTLTRFHNSHDLDEWLHSLQAN